MTYESQDAYRMFAWISGLVVLVAVVVIAVLLATGT